MYLVYLALCEIHSYLVAGILRKGKRVIFSLFFFWFSSLVYIDSEVDVLRAGSGRPPGGLRTSIGRAPDVNQTGSGRPLDELWTSTGWALDGLRMSIGRFE